MAVEPVGRSGRHRNTAAVATGPLVLGPTDSLKGTLRTESGVTIHGDVEGEILAIGDVIVESTATVIATLEGRNIDIRGQVRGNVTSTRRLSLSGSGSLQGDATAARLVVQDGATLNGSISMSGGGKDIDQGDETSPAEFTAETEASNGEMVAVGEQEHSG
jgi:cytoskeletal protein CcmA (bactofilin family)